MLWTLGRIALHTGIRDPAELRTEHVDELLAAVRGFGERPEVAEFYGSPALYRVSPSRAWITHLHMLGVLLYHRGQSHHRPPEGSGRIAHQAHGGKQAAQGQ